jgi:hypothetical protein
MERARRCIVTSMHSEELIDANVHARRRGRGPVRVLPSELQDFKDQTDQI